MKLDKKKYFLNFFVIFSVTAIVLYFTIGQNLKETIELLIHANKFLLLFAIAFMWLYYIFDSLILYVLGKIYNKDYSFKQAFVNSTAGTFFNGITPFASGGQFMQIFMFKKQKINASNATGILLVLFICYQTILVLISAVIFIVKIDMFKSDYTAIISLALLGFLVNVIVILGLVLLSCSKTIHNLLLPLFLKIGIKLRIVKNYEETEKNANNYLTTFRQQLFFLSKNIKILFEVSLFNVVKLVVLYCVPFLVCRILNIPCTLGDCLHMMALTSFIYLINAFLPLPGSSGGSEGCFLLLFGYLGAGRVATAMVLWRFISYYMGLIVGGLSFALDPEIHS